MPGYQRARIWEEKELTDQIRASLLSTPDASIIASSTSNMQMEPCCLVLLDNKYPVIGLMSVTIKRSRNAEANTASFTIQNIQTRYSGANKAKIAANTKVSIYVGYSKKYIQRFEGYIDTTAMSVNGSQSTVTVNCRDRAKEPIERTISAGMYSKQSEYLGEGDWHYQLGRDRDGNVTHEPRPWKRSEVLRDICYILGLRDIASSMWVEEVYNTTTGFTTYVRHISYGPQFVFDIDEEWDSEITCNFTDEVAWDILAKLAQSIFHEVLFDQFGRLVVRPVKTASDPAEFYFKEERDIESLSHNVDDDNVINSIVIKGQTSSLTAVTYPFAPVAVSDEVKLEKGQDEYGWNMTYPSLVAPENFGSLTHPSLYAHTIYPNSEPVASREDNPENHPQYDVRIHYPSFNKPYEKQLCLEATCPIITDEASMANRTNVRTWNFYGELDTAVMYEKQPIMLEDRFGKPILVVCKERSMDDERIKFLPDGTPTGNTPYNPDDPATIDPDAVPVNIPTEYTRQTFSVSSSLEYTYTTSEGSDGTPVYNGIPGSSYTLYGIKLASSMPSSALAAIPSGMSASDFTGKLFTLTQFTVTKGTSPYPSVIPHHVYDMAVMTTICSYMAICERTITIPLYTYTSASTGSTYTAPEAPFASIVGSATPTTRVVSPTTSPLSICSNCTISSVAGARQVVVSAPGVTDFNSLPSDAVKGAAVSNITVKYPCVWYCTSTLTSENWHPIMLLQDTLLDALLGVEQSRGRSMTVFTATIDSSYVTRSDPDCNVIYWRWMGSFTKPPTDTTSGPTSDYWWVSVKDKLNSDWGRDANGNRRVQITRAEFYKLAADPHTVVIECMTAGIDHKSWAEVIHLDENLIVCKGHNLYGSMRDAYKELLDALSRWLEYISFALIALSVWMAWNATVNMTTLAQAFTPGMVQGILPVYGNPFDGMAIGPIDTTKQYALFNVQNASNDAATAAQVALMMDWIAAFLTGALGIATFVKSRNIDNDIGANISKVMEDMSCRITGVRKPEIEMYEPAACQAAQWWLVGADGKHTGQTMEYQHFTYVEGTNLHDIYKQQLQDDTYDYLGTTRQRSWVFIMDLTKPGPGFWATSDPTPTPMFPAGAMVTAFGWETPEIGDRNPIAYYTGVDYEGASLPESYRKEIHVRYAIEAFADDPYDTQYDALTLLRLRFENQSIGGMPNLKPGTNECWYNSKGYDVLVDRSMNPETISDTGIWYDFFERDEDYREHRYKYLALVIYSWDEQHYTRGNSTVALPSSPGDRVQSEPANPATIFDKNRWGIFIPRGLNRAWYNKFRWFERMDGTGSPQIEQNYIYADIIFAGQERLIANLLNNFKYSAVSAEIRVWGKAFGQFAPTLVYYADTNMSSIATYGERQLVLENNCINDYRVAKRLASMLTGQSNESFNMTTTGKPYIFEGAVVMVKEENSGAIAGVFRNWENIWKYPDRKTTVQPSNLLNTISIPGVYFPQCATPTYANRVLVACGHQSNTDFPLYLVELDSECNAFWYMLGMSPEQPTFIIRWEGVGGQYNANANTYTIVGLKTGDILKFDYRVANQVGRYVLAGETPLCGNMDEEQAVMFVGSEKKIYCIDLANFVQRFIDTSGGATGIACAIWKVYDKATEDYAYTDYGVVFTCGAGGIVCRKMYADKTRKALGPVLATLAPGTFGIPFSNPGSLEYDKSLGELVYVNRSSANETATIWGIKVDVDFDPAFPDIPMTVEFTHVSWSIDYMNDADLVAAFPNAASRRTYINKFFRPNHAIYDVNRDLLISDPHNNRVYKLNPSGKFYVTSVTDSIDISDTATSYKQSYEMVTVAAAGSLQLTNFGKNFLNTKTEEQIEAAATTAMARIISALPRDMFVVKLLTSNTVMEAVNNSGELLRVHDTVLVVTGYNGDSSGVGSIIAKKALNDWSIETGEPYTYADATSVDATKYGQLATSSGGGSSVDLSVYNARIRQLENNVRTLAGLHGLTL